MKVLLTGGAGFIGRRTAEALVARGDEVVAMDILSEQVHQDPEASASAFPGELLRADVCDPTAWTGAPKVEAVVHLAAETGTAQSMYQRERYERVNIEGTRSAARFAADLGVPFVFMSSRAVYGEGLVADQPHRSEPGRDFGPDGRLVPSRETDPHRPLSYYGQTKSEGERVVRDSLGEAGPWAVLRPQNVVGMGQALHNPYTGVLAAFLARIQAGQNLSIYGDGTQTRDFVHVEDVAGTIVWVLDRLVDGAEPMTLNVGTGTRMDLDELAACAIAAGARAGGGDPVGVEHVQVHRPGDIDHACADMTHARFLGAPEPQWSSASAIAEFIVRSWGLAEVDPALWDRVLSELDQHPAAAEDS